MNLSKALCREFSTGKSLLADPGWSTGWALYSDGDYYSSGILKCKQGMGKRVMSVEQRLVNMHMQFEMLCDLLRPDAIYIESVTRYSNASGEAALNTDELFNTAFLIGDYLAQAITMGIPFYLLKAPEWKGSMSKKVVMNRIQLALGRKFSNHAADAVGMGLAIMGKL